EAGTAPALAGVEEVPDVGGEEVGGFEGCEVAAAVELRPADDVAGLGGERADGYVGGEDRHGGRDGGALLGRPHGRVVEPLVVGVGGRAGGGGEPVDADVGQDPVAVHGVFGQQGGRVGPPLELLHDP